MPKPNNRNEILFFQYENNFNLWKMLHKFMESHDIFKKIESLEENV